MEENKEDTTNEKGLNTLMNELSLGDEDTSALKNKKKNKKKPAETT